MRDHVAPGQQGLEFLGAPGVGKALRMDARAGLAELRAEAVDGRGGGLAKPARHQAGAERDMGLILGLGVRRLEVERPRRRPFRIGEQAEPGDEADIRRAGLADDF